ncbi:hydrolase [Acutalibacter muris]|uniref:hydrolase n=1 Tax=Acutalibacter muris TaxID=1796620 RepID=UPI001C3E9EFC|nr:hydrolase [Acutalibacter muris]
MTNAERFKAIYTTQIERAGAPELLAWLESTDFFTAPASTKYHGARPGGLVDHSLNVYDELISRVPSAGTAESRAVCALLHDICKADYYEPLNGGGYQVKDRFPFGHGEKSVLLISRFMPLTDEEALAIRWHMGAYDEAARGGSRTLSAAMAASPLVYELHAADMRATQREQREENRGLS